MIKIMRSLLGDYKTICLVENQILHPTQRKYIEDWNTLQENVGLTRKESTLSRPNMN